MTTINRKNSRIKVVFLHKIRLKKEIVMKNRLGLADIKDKVTNLQGQNIALKINKGRNKIVYFDGIISEFYNNVFVITVFDQIFDRISCSYTDLLCGDVAFKVQNSSK